MSFERNENYQARLIDCSELTDFEGNARNDIISNIKDKDKKYLTTFPGQSFLMKFSIGTPAPGLQRSYFLKSRGFYIEWLRKDWFNNKRTNGDNIKFDLSSKTIIETAKLWLKKKHSFEKKFFESKISQY
ncbi:MAG: hypothetical protein JSV96_07685 [Candidatus Aminicenantes bacterium]|nr:MAG: hypothetical protein JSV96_07685 [Candidatus Aminicenantes bacterium]